MGEIHLPTLNACLNTLAFCLLLAGRFFIYKEKKALHAKTMLAAVVVSFLFLISYSVYHFQTHAVTRYSGEGIGKVLYLIMLVSHIVLAALILPFILRVLWLARQKKWEKHRRLARIVWPVWLYVSITGVLIYIVLYL